MFPWYHFPLVALAVLGVILSNRKIIWCYACWTLTNAAWGYINYAHGLPVEAIQNLIFLALAAEGAWKWRQR